MEEEKCDSIFFKIKKLDKLIGRTLRFNATSFASKNDMKIIPSRSQMEILNYILDHFNEEIYQKDLEQALSLRRATISGILETMEKNGLIIRIVDERDTRTKKVRLSQGAKNVYEEGRKHVDKLEQKAILGISESDMKIFYKVIDKIESNICMGVNSSENV